MVQYLVIVESPGKILSVSKFLNDSAQPGDHFVVKATGGHIMNLNPKKLSIQIENNFEPEYILQEDAWHKKAIAEIKQAYKSCDQVIIASDCDLEGENIGYSVCQLLKLPIETTKRLVFIEITKKAIQQAMQQNTFLRPSLLDAQKSRRVLDRLIGYKISPVTRKIKTGLSVGRVQSIALKLVVDREHEIEAFQSQRQFKVMGVFNPTQQPPPQQTTPQQPPSQQIYTTLDTVFTNKDNTVQFLNQCQQPPAEFTISSIKKKIETTNPSPPFITATLQQECCRKFNLTAKQVMDVAQKLYERGLISYPRTDSPHLPEEKMAAIKAYVIDKYGEKYHHERQYKAKNSSAQEAHSCIYPIKVETPAISSGENSNPIEAKIYQIVHRRAVASQMAAAKIAATEILIDISTTDVGKFKGRAEELVFDGFRKIYQFADHSEVADDEGSAGDETANMKNNAAYFKELKEGDKLNYQTITAKECYTNPKARYDYAGLVKSMEALKVGRPSTYPTILENVIQRGYIVKESRKGEKKTLITLEMTQPSHEIKETTRQQVCGAVKNKFFPTDVGIALEAFIKTHFDNIFNYEFSKEMEDALKQIETGEVVWHEIIRQYYQSFQPIVDQLDASMPAFTSPGKSLKEKRHVGTLPDGRQAYAYVTKNGPAVQILSEKDIQEIGGEGGGKKIKGQFVSLDNKNLINKITVEDVVRMIQLPKTIGQMDGKNIIIKKGPHGIYLSYNGTNHSCHTELLETSPNNNESPTAIETGDVDNLSLEKVSTYLKSKMTTVDGTPAKKANNVIKVIENGKNLPIKVMNGKFGPFFIMNKTIVGIPESVKPEDLTLPVCKALLDNKKNASKKGAPAKKSVKIIK